MPTVLGQLDVSLINSYDMPIAMDETIHQIDKAITPLMTILMNKKFGKLPVTNPIFYHLEDEQVPIFATAAAAVAAAGTSLTVQTGQGSYAVAGDTWFNTRVREEFLVTVVSGTTWTITKGKNGTTDQAWLAGDELVNIGSAFREDAEAPDPRATKSVTKTFYCQDFRDTIQLTKTMAATKTYYGSRRAYDQRKLLLRHKIKMELASYLGGTGENYDIDSDGAAKMRFASGMLGCLTDNEFDCDGKAFTMPVLWDAVGQAADYHTGDFLFLASPNVMRIMAGWSLAKFEKSDVLADYDLNGKVMQCPDADVHVVRGPLLKGNNLKKLSFLIPMPVEEFFKFRPLIGNGENHDTKLYLDIKKDNRPSVYKDEVETQAGFQLLQTIKWNTIKNISG